MENTALDAGKLREFLPADREQYLEGEEGYVWVGYEREGRSSWAKKVDLIGAVGLEEYASGISGWRERVRLKLGQDEGQLSHNSIGDYFSIFRTVRVRPPYGLGFSMSEATKYNSESLRIVAQHHSWAVSHPGEVRELLDTKNLKKGELRDAIREKAGIPAKSQDQDLSAYAPLELRVAREDLFDIKAMLEGAVLKYQTHDALEFSKLDRVRWGEVMLQVLIDWYTLSTQTVLESGEVQIVAHNEFLTREQNEDDMDEKAHREKEGGNPSPTIPFDSIWSESESVPF